MDDKQWQNSVSIYCNVDAYLQQRNIPRYSKFVLLYCMNRRINEKTVKGR